MSVDNSPMYALGRADAWADNERVKNGNDPVGKQPPYPRYRTMYDRGYDDHFDPVPPDKNAPRKRRDGWPFLPRSRPATQADHAAAGGAMAGARVHGFLVSDR